MMCTFEWPTAVTDFQNIEGPLMVNRSDSMQSWKELWSPHLRGSGLLLNKEKQSTDRLIERQACEGPHWLMASAHKIKDTLGSEAQVSTRRP